MGGEFLLKRHPLLRPAEEKEKSDMCSPSPRRRQAKWGGQISRKSEKLGLLRGGRGEIPFPVANFGHVLAVFVDVLFVLDQFVADGLFDVGGAGAELGTRSITSATR